MFRGCCPQSREFQCSQETEDNKNNIGMRKIVDRVEETATEATGTASSINFLLTTLKAFQNYVDESAV